MKMKMIRLVAIVAGVLCLRGIVAADAARLSAAQTVLTEMSGAQDSGIPADLIAQARCLVVIPGVKKAALVVGGEYGRGYISCRGSGAAVDGHSWSAPGGIRIEGGSVGFQIGGSETDVILIVRNQAGVDRLLSNQFTVGADAAVAAGPIGRQASAKTDATMRAEMLAYSHSRGVFAGIALQGATLREDADENTQLYGTARGNREIVSGSVAVPAAARDFVATLSKY
jgi:lipid-binding SYLF domain-containing protein